MADKKISDLTAATSLSASDLFEIENAGGNSRKMTAANAKLYMLPSRVFTNTLSNASTTALIPADNTIPQVTEGQEALTLSITPTSTTAKIRVEVILKFSHSIASQWVIAALFINGGANAVESGTFWNITAGGGGGIVLVYEYVPGSTSAQTIAVRAGASGGAGTLTFNALGANTLGGVIKSSMSAIEIA